MSGDDFHVTVISDIRQHFEWAIKMLFDGYYPKAEAYQISKEHGMVLYGRKTATSCQPLPYIMNAESAIEFAWGWLKNVDYNDYGNKPDPDEAPRKGFKVYNIPYGGIGSNATTIAVIRPFWMEYSK